MRLYTDTIACFVRSLRKQRQQPLDGHLQRITSLRGKQETLLPLLQNREEKERKPEPKCALYEVTSSTASFKSQKV